MMARRLIMVLVAGVAVCGLNRQAAGQTPTTSTHSLVVAGYANAVRPTDWSMYQTPAACTALFQRTMQTMTYDRLIDKKVEHVAGSDFDNDWIALPDSAIQVARTCIQHLPDGVEQIPAYTLPTFLTLAIGVNDDSLVKRIVVRQLRLASASAHDTAAVLDSVVSQLMDNHWNITDHNSLHLTQAHVQLAKQYAAQINSRDPSVLSYRLHTLIELDKGWQGDGTDVDAQLTHVQAELQRTNQLSVENVPQNVRQAVQLRQLSLKSQIAWLTYLKTLSLTDLNKWMQQRKPYVVTAADTLVGTRAGTIRGDYWFNIPDPDHPPIIPTPGKVSLIEFFASDLRGGDASKLEELRRLHEKFPTLQIVLVTLTNGVFHQKNVIEHPETEADFIRQYFTDSLKIPGIVCVVKGTYRTVVGGHILPLANSVFNNYDLDPRASLYDGREFLVNADGRIVSTLGIRSLQDEELIRRLIALNTPPSGTIQKSSEHE
jgi:hypothetical protein